MWFKSNSKYFLYESRINKRNSRHAHTIRINCASDSVIWCNDSNVPCTRQFRMSFFNLNFLLFILSFYSENKTSGLNGPQRVDESHFLWLQVPPKEKTVLLSCFEVWSKVVCVVPYNVYHKSHEHNISSTITYMTHSHTIVESIVQNGIDFYTKCNVFYIGFTCDWWWFNCIWSKEWWNITGRCYRRI